METYRMNSLKDKSSKTGIIMALLSLYVVWGSTYLAIRIALEGFPPFLMAGLRYIVAGSVLYLFLRMRGASHPGKKEWTGACIVGGFLLLGGNGGVAIAEQWVASGVAALVIATTPLWTVLFAGIWKRWPARAEWAGIVLGLAGVAILNMGGELRAHPAGAVALLLAAMFWALGSAWSRHLSLPQGMMASAAEMIAGGTLLLLSGLLTGERIETLPGLRAVGALVYLIVFGSLVGFSSYVYLLGRVRPALATSYAYVNPIIAVVLGVVLAGESITGTEFLAVPVILAGVVLVILGNKKKRGL